MALFLSTFVNKVDRKGRVSVPASFRATLGEQTFHGIIVYPSFKNTALEGSGIDRLEEMNARLDALDQFSEEHEALRSIFADAQQLPLDSDGRIILSAFLCEHAGITDSAAFVGLGSTFQIWKPEEFQRRQAELRERAKRSGMTLPALRTNGEPRR